MREVGAERFLAPREAGDEELSRLHDADYIRQVRTFSDHPSSPTAMGIGTPDVPAFDGMHRVSAQIAGGSIDAVEAILAGQAAHAFAPAGGLHHAMPSRASGFCVYNDVALAVATARDAGHRVLYVDLDVHHGDGTQVHFWDDAEVLTLSIHESGQSLFPGSGAIDERGGPHSLGTAVNVPLEPSSGDDSWWPIVESMVTALAKAFAPTFLVTQHGCDSHALDPLANLRITTASYARACHLLDTIAHERCEGRWLATGGGGYDVYRVVPRSWALIWLTQAHRDVPAETPPAWRQRWSADAEAHGQAPPPTDLIDAPGSVGDDSAELVSRNSDTAARSLEQALGDLSSD
jgi:acetoin utilization protein AcuC